MMSVQTTKCQGPQSCFSISKGMSSVEGKVTLTKEELYIGAKQGFSRDYWEKNRKQVEWGILESAEVKRFGEEGKEQVAKENEKKNHLKGCGGTKASGERARGMQFCTIGGDALNGVWGESGIDLFKTDVTGVLLNIRTCEFDAEGRGNLLNTGTE